MISPITLLNLIYTIVDLSTEYTNPVMAHANQVANSIGLNLELSSAMSYSYFADVYKRQVLEAARIDGAKERTIFWRIIMPSVKPVWMTMLVFSFGGLWNRSDTNYIFSEQLKGLQTLLQQLSAGGIARMLSLIHISTVPFSR